MRRAKRVIGGFGALGETAQPVLHPQGADTVAAFGQDLVRIALVPDIPDYLVARRVEHRMQSHGKLDHAQPGTKMATGDGYGGNRLRPQLVRELVQLLVGQRFHIRRAVDLVEQRCFGTV